MSATLSLESYLAGEWSRGQGIESELVDPTNGTVLATVSARGLDLDGALKFARQKGSPALRALSYAARAKMLGAIADVLAMKRAMKRLRSPIQATQDLMRQSTSTAVSER